MNARTDRHALKLLRDALYTLEASIPPRGGATWKMCQRIKRFLKKAR